MLNEYRVNVYFLSCVISIFYNNSEWKVFNWWKSCNSSIFSLFMMDFNFFWCDRFCKCLLAMSHTLGLRKTSNPGFKIISLTGKLEKEQRNKLEFLFLCILQSFSSWSMEFHSLIYEKSLWLVYVVSDAKVFSFICACKYNFICTVGLLWWHNL